LTSGILLFYLFTLRRDMRRILFLIFAITNFHSPAQVLPSFGNSRTGTAGMQFLKTGIDARSMGMAGAVVASPVDAASMYWNPSGITRIDSGSKLYITANHCSWFAKTDFDDASIVYRFKYRFWGLRFNSFHSQPMKETTEFQPTGTGRTFNFSDILIGITYAQQLTNNFSFGLSGKFVNESFAGISTNNVLFDLGLYYDVHVRNIRFAAVISNFGINVKPHGEVTALKLGGISETSDFSAFSAPSIFRVGISSLLLKQSSHLLSGSFQLNHPGDNNETFALGFEYEYNKLLFARTGFEFGADEKGWPVFGFGIKLPRRFGGVTIDYAWQNKPVFGNVQRFGITVSHK